MAVKLRLMRMGRKKAPFYRVVAADARSPRDGKFIEVVGTYNPLKNPAEIKLDSEKVNKWLEVGAVPTDTVRNLIKKSGLNKVTTAKKPKAEKEKTTKKTTTKKEEK